MEKLETRIVAVSVDDAESQRTFARANWLPFPLVPDTDLRIAKLYGVDRDGKARRVTFLIDAKGVVRHVEDPVHVPTHGPDMLTRLRGM
jgi:peroxiredoxin Q/BCP